MPQESQKEFNISSLWGQSVIMGQSTKPLGRLGRFNASCSPAVIAKSVDFDSDHLDCFSYKDPIGRTIEVYHPYYQYASGKTTADVLVGDLPLQPGDSLTYVSNFGDHWEFNLLLETIEPGKPKRGCNKVWERHGKAPEQYPSWEEDE